MDIIFGEGEVDRKRRLKLIVLVFSLLELGELVRVVSVTEWLLTTRWDKTVIIELVFLALLLVTNLLLYLGTLRRSPVELLAWFVSHLVFLVVQVVLLVYYIVVMFIIISPTTQNSWLGLPKGMSSNTSEFQQELRYSLGVNISWLVTLLITVPTTAMGVKIVWQEKQNMEEELNTRQAKYSIKAEYRGSGSGGETPSNSQMRNSQSIQSLHRDQGRRFTQPYLAPVKRKHFRSYRRSHSDLVYTVPHTQNTFLPGPQYQESGGQWSRQTSMDTSYNVPSIRSEMGEQEGRAVGRELGRFDSIAEVTESRTDQDLWRNRGQIQQTF